MAAPFLCFLVLANWGLAKPWMDCWTVEKHITALVSARRGQFGAGTAILLAHCPRYVNWSPLFDGVWDFEAMLHMNLNDRNIQGGVVSDRMVLSRSNIKDISAGFTCGTYPFRQLFVFVPNPEQWIPIGYAQQFIQTINAKGMGFGLSRSTIERWHRELAEVRRSPGLMPGMPAADKD